MAVRLTMLRSWFISRTKKAAHELRKMLQDSNLPFKMNTSGSIFPPGNYILAFNYKDGKFQGTATLMYPIEEWKKLELSPT